MARNAILETANFEIETIKPLDDSIIKVLPAGWRYRLHHQWDSDRFGGLAHISLFIAATENASDDDVRKFFESIGPDGDGIDGQFEIIHNSKKLRALMIAAEATSRQNGGQMTGDFKS